MVMCLFPLFADNEGAEYPATASPPITAANPMTEIRTAKTRRDFFRGRNYHTLSGVVLQTA